LAAELKLPSVFTWIDNFLAESDEKLVVFGVHHKILIPLYQRYKKISVLINGQVTGKDRQRAIDKFQHDKRCRFLFGNYRAAGVGADHTAASTGISVELPWTPAEAIQGEDRLSRIGQRLPVNFFYLVAKGTIEERHCELLQKKQSEILDPVLDGKKNKRDFSIYEQLEKELIGQ
jgi:SNF2 family DNA or RNA helicase